MPRELDELMDLDPLQLHKDPTALDEIIAYHRQRRAELAEGKGKRPKKDTGPKVGLGDLMKTVLNKPKPEAPVAKPGFRRI